MYQRIRDLREDKDLKQRELAEILNCSQRVYSNYELGQRDIPTDVLIRLSRFYQVSTDYILGLTNNPKQINNTAQTKCLCGVFICMQDCIQHSAI